MYDMTSLCGYQIGSAVASTPAASSARSMQSAAPADGTTVQLTDDGSDGTLIMTPATPLQMVILALPATGKNMQIRRIASMRDIATIQFTNGTVLNAPTELLGNQSVSIERIDTATNTWITI